MGVLFVRVLTAAYLLFSASQVLAEVKELKSDGIGQCVLDLGLVPRFNPSGKVVHYQVLSIDPNSDWEKSGLREKDIVKGIDNIVVDSATELARFFKIGENADRHTISILRNGNAMLLSFLGPLRCSAPEPLPAAN